MNHPKPSRAVVAALLLLLPSLDLSAASNPSPAYAWQSADPDTVLKWTAESGELSYNVYFGLDSTPDETEFRGNQTVTVFTPGALLPDTDYYWRIDAVTSTGVVTGSLWHFHTGALPGGITRVNLMPNEPANYSLRDWKAVAQDFDAIVSNQSLTGPYLPIAQKETGLHNIVADTTAPTNPPFYWMASFIGDNDDGGAFGTIANVVGASLVGVDKSNHFGRNHVTAQASYFSIDNEHGVFYNSLNGGLNAPQEFWYQIIANIDFWQLTSLYPSIAANTTVIGNKDIWGVGDSTYTMDEMMLGAAEQWHAASVVLNGDYNYFGFDFETMQPASTGGTLTPHAAAGLAWLQYTAYKKFNDPDYLADADTALNYLHGLTFNPAHDVLVPYGAVTAARMNAELGRNYNVGQFINWHFDLGTTGDVNENTGVEVGSWGGYPVDGLVGKPGLGKVYALNTFVSAAALAPVARYDSRYARSLGKWLLNVASNARFLYSNAFTSANQTNKDWTDLYDPTGSISYEFLSDQGWIVSRALSDYSHSYGTIVAGTYVDSQVKNSVYQKMKETLGGDGIDRLDHIWSMNLHAGYLHDFKVRGKIIDRGDADAGFRFSYSTSASGPWTTIMTMTNTSVAEVSKTFGGTTLSGPVYIRVEDTSRSTGSTSSTLDELWLDVLLVQTRDANTVPFLAGGYEGHGGPSNLCLYQSASVGYFGAIVEPSLNVSKILQIDLLATNFFHDPAYPTYLFYNPYATSQNVQVNVGSAVDVYDTVTHSFLLTNVSGVQTVAIPADSARVLVFAPTGLSRVYDGRKLSLNGKVIDYYYPVKTRLFYDGFESGSFDLPGAWTRQATYTAVQTPAAYTGSTYGVKLSQTAWMERAVSTAGYKGIYVKYRRATTGYDAGENLIVEWSVNGTVWNNLETVTTAAYGDGLQNKSCGTGANNQAGFRVRFRTTASDGLEYAYLDNIEILGQPE